MAGEVCALAQVGQPMRATVTAIAIILTKSTPLPPSGHSSAAIFADVSRTPLNFPLLAPICQVLRQIGSQVAVI